MCMLVINMAKKKDELNQNTILIVAGIIIAAYFISQGNYFSVLPPSGSTPSLAGPSWAWPSWLNPTPIPNPNPELPPGINPPAGTCTDADVHAHVDWSDLKIASSCRDSIGETFYDSCRTTDVVIEYLCSGLNCLGTDYSCSAHLGTGWTCSSGACVYSGGEAGGGGTYTSSTCASLASSLGHQYSSLQTSEGNCANYVGNYCYNLGMEGAYDYTSNCCTFNCQAIQQSTCQTYCSSRNLLLIQTGQWTEVQCYNSAIYVCNSLQNLETSIISPDGTCCCYRCYS